MVEKRFEKYLTVLSYNPLSRLESVFSSKMLKEAATYLKAAASLLAI